MLLLSNIRLEAGLGKTKSCDRDAQAAREADGVRFVKGRSDAD